MLQTYFTAFQLSRYERKKTLFVRKKTLNFQTGIVNIFQLSRPSLFEERPSLEQESALQHPRTCPSCTLKTPFLVQEGHVLKHYL